ncbi:putative trans-sulfuration enzyme [Fusarium oxysporum f. sp. raphani]|uniref:Putative trans-sulfuration enzyme n=1 Tax=Fusarium oxysporum f. sp. raphani TaxID=96318 RepID=A0A8J5Q3P5_FUSOX|nr:putative trans-sulfuration enzyme [Fusarium oxysporum f. sp. raphani]
MSLSVDELEATFSLATNGIHVDDRYAGTDVAPAMHPSTTFRYPYDPDKLVPQQALSKTDMVYARLARPTGSRLELILSKLLKGEALVYSTGLSAIHAYLVRLGPKKVAIGGGYHGTHAVLDIHERLTGTVRVGLDELDQLGPGDIAKEKRLYLVVDSTFGPPALQDPFMWGADIVIHSGTKYIGGHSDIMCGVLAVQREDLFNGLWEDRVALGNILVASIMAWPSELADFGSTLSHSKQ